MDTFYTKLDEEEEKRSQKYMVVYLRIASSYELQSLAVVVCALALFAFGAGLAKEPKLLDLHFYLCLLLTLSASAYLWLWAADNVEKVKQDQTLNLNGARLASLLQFCSAAFNALLAFGLLIQTRYPEQLAEGLQLSSTATTTVAVLLGLTTLCQLRGLHLLWQATWDELEVSVWVFLPAGVAAIYSGTRILYSAAFWTRDFPLQTCRVVVVLLLISQAILSVAALRISSRKSDTVFSSALGCGVLTVLFIGAFGIPCFDRLGASADARTRKNVAFSLKHFPLLIVACVASLQTAVLLYQSHYSARKPLSDLMLKIVFFGLVFTALASAIYPQEEPGTAPQPAST